MQSLKNFISHCNIIEEIIVSYLNILEKEDKDSFLDELLFYYPILSVKSCSIYKVKKFKSENVKFYCDNAADFDYKKLYDCIIIYNAFPHFDEPLRLFEHLTRHLRKGGTLTVCHGMSREKIIAHHENVSHVSHLLPEADELKEMMGKYLRVVSVISDEKMYLVSGIKE